jgi:hypothetical protein
MLKYFIRPTYQIEGIEDLGIGAKLKGTLNNFAVYICVALVLYMILSTIDFGITKYFNFSILEQMRENQQRVMQKYGDDSILLILFIGPFFEEVLFRLPLKLTKVGIGVSCSLLTYRILVDHFFIFDFRNPYAYFSLSAAVIVFFLIVIIFPDPKLTLVKQKYFAHFFYFVAISFALVHLSNFAPFNSQVYLFYPIFVLPQLLMGLLIGYTRVKYGFIYGLAIHSMINLPSAIIMSLLK